MNHIVLKWVKLWSPLFILLVMAGCVKPNKATFTDFSQVSDHVVLRNSGLANFKASNIRFAGDTMTYDVIVDLASVGTSGNPIKVTLAVDDAKRTGYNTTNGTNFLAFTNDMYKLGTTTLTIPAGQHYAQTTLQVFHTASIDPTKSYMLPVSISDASGKALSSNLNTLYFNIIGNPLAGAYHWDFTRWNNNTGTGTPSSLSFTGETTSFVADDPNTIEVQSGYFIQPRYVLTFTSINGVLSNFQVSLNADDVKEMETGGVTVSSAPVILTADPVNRIFEFQYAVSTGGGPRYIIDKYYP